MTRELQINFIFYQSNYRHEKSQLTLVLHYVNNTMCTNIPHYVKLTSVQYYILRNNVDFPNNRNAVILKQIVTSSSKQQCEHHKDPTSIMIRIRKYLQIRSCGFYDLPICNTQIVKSATCIKVLKQNLTFALPTTKKFK